MPLGGVSGLANPRFNRRTNNFGPSGPDYSPQNAYSQAIPQQAGDYDEIMQGYRNILGQGGGGYDDAINKYKGFLESGGGDFTPAEYKQASEWGESYNKLKDLADTGGLSESDRADLRARGVSPIRAIYANMNRNLDRQRALQGGYSPNYGAVAAKLAREGSESIAGGIQNVNAEIAKMVQEGKLKATPELANMAAGKNNLINQIGLANSENKLKASQLKTSALEGYGNLINQKNQVPLDALKGMTSLYGTTPALVNTFGNQVMQQAEMQNNALQAKARNRATALGGFASKFR